jgi:hypothetical protein
MRTRSSPTLRSVLAAIAFCPSPPLLVPELAAGAAAELDPLRAACDRAVRTLHATGPEEIIVIATGPRTERFPAGTPGTLAGYGLPIEVRLPGPPTSGYALPPALSLGAVLLAGTDVPASALAVGPAADPAGLAFELDRGAGRRALLVLGDGSARRTEQAPGYVDARAEPFDAAVAAALASGDAAALRDLDAGLGAELLAVGVPAWRVAGHAAARAGAWSGELLHDAAPYGVGYLAAVWVPA